MLSYMIKRLLSQKKSVFEEWNLAGLSHGVNYYSPFLSNFVLSKLYTELYGHVHVLDDPYPCS